MYLKLYFNLLNINNKIKPLIIFLYRPSIFSALKGGFKAANSYKIIPKDQISDFKSYA